MASRLDITRANYIVGQISRGVVPDQARAKADTLIGAVQGIAELKREADARAEQFRQQQFAPVHMKRI